MGILQSTDRVIVVNRRSTRVWAKEFARALGQDTSPIRVLRHTEFKGDKEYKPTFRFDDVASYNPQLGKQLEGKTVYIVSTDSSHLSRQAMTFHNLLIAQTAKYNGAAKVVLVQPSLFYDAQERGIHDAFHPRMQTEEGRRKFNGEGPTLRFVAELYRTAGIDNIVTVHSHCPEDVKRIFKDVYAREEVVLDLDIAPVVGVYFGQLNMEGQLAISNEGENLVFVGPDAGAKPFVMSVAKASGLSNASYMCGVKSRKDETRVAISFDEASDNFNGCKDKTLIYVDDKIRTGNTIATGVRVLHEDPHNRPEAAIAYGTHTSLEQAAGVLDLRTIRRIVVTNSIPTVVEGCGELENKVTVLGIERFMADAVIQCIEGNANPRELYTPQAIQKRFRELVKPYSC